MICYNCDKDFPVEPNKRCSYCDDGKGRTQKGCDFYVCDECASLIMNGVEVKPIIKKKVKKPYYDYETLGRY